MGGTEEEMPDPGWKDLIRTCTAPGCPLYRHRPYKLKENNMSQKTREITASDKAIPKDIKAVPAASDQPHHVEIVDDIKEIVGTSSDDFLNSMFNQLYLAHPDVRDVQPTDIFNQIIPALRAIGPKDEFEAMLAVQIVATHNLSMGRLARAAQKSDTRAIDQCVTQATKLSRTFLALVDGLNKHRGKGHQKMTVEHVHVNQGGQAVIGNVGGRGGKNET